MARPLPPGLNWSAVQSSDYGHCRADLLGHQIEYWPESRRRTFRYRGTTYRGKNIEEFIDLLLSGKRSDNPHENGMSQEEIDVSEKAQWGWVKIDGSLGIYIVHEGAPPAAMADQVIARLREAASYYKKEKERGA